MNKKPFVVILTLVFVALTCALVATMSLSTVPADDAFAELSDASSLSPEGSTQPESWGMGTVYDGTSPLLRKMGEELVVDALVHRKQTEKPPTSIEVFALWEGSLGFTVNSATLYDSIEATGLNYDDFIDDFSNYESTYKPMVINLTVRNIDAQSYIDETRFYSGDYIISSKEEFSPEKFRSHPNGHWRVTYGMPLAYVSPNSPGPYDYFLYPLSKGESVDLTLCYYIDTAYVPMDELYLEIMTSSDDHRFGIHLDRIEEAGQ